MLDSICHTNNDNKCELRQTRGILIFCCVAIARISMRSGNILSRFIMYESQHNQTNNTLRYAIRYITTKNTNTKNSTKRRAHIHSSQRNTQATKLFLNFELSFFKVWTLMEQKTHTKFSNK